jgi:hypothetical protein
MRNRWAEYDRLEGMLKVLTAAKWIIQNDRAHWRRSNGLWNAN